MKLSSHTKHRVLVATRNPGKFQEMLELMWPNFELLRREAASEAPEIEEDGDTFEINARLKAEGVSKFFPGWVLAEDSGIEVDALYGAPGVYSARFAGAKATDAQNRTLLLKLLENLRVPEKRRTARLRCALALARSGRLLLTSSGTVEGRVTREEKGSGGFGYDALFLPTGFGRTLAELPTAVKNKISHRRDAITALCRLWSVKMKQL
ncbi:dITP/XTP pyrophosphatase [Candidatus Xiphinematobacter sp. Idaho Grape]|uniref:RdgB/HAM1 family non-canonical purine NTP pyrophosphatase n=1 Tax=Candidatus Xiphinematobacter sp. Idaho Grape TaxID=1704307 RepID=UPI000705F823|nr:RdgB/HAM1 family non-canonical purine NTP pyrophosphatase [Candidatus Xiphinematobacter sp. Idaho Grape]ALJ56474.1 dITP/XTP pyrophosphatase [Candidatus Xiphinematobacter sp. Idaho Grape]